jgi:hypothetical protein
VTDFTWAASAARIEALWVEAAEAAGSGGVP